MKILVTGSDGFIAKNLLVFLREQKIETFAYGKNHSVQDLDDYIKNADFIFHLAGVNRALQEQEFKYGNIDITQQIVNILKQYNKSTPIVYSSSTQVNGPMNEQNIYAQTKLYAEKILLEYQHITDAKIYIYRLPNVFGKWAKPNYNSAVATFCYNTVYGLPIKVNDPSVQLTLLYIDDLLLSFKKAYLNELKSGYVDISNYTTYQITVGELAKQIQNFPSNRSSLLIDKVGSGLTRALYSTYLTYMPAEHFAYTIPAYKDERGRFVEMLKTPETGQFSFFTAHPGVTRGGHYHHSKNEKFLVISGKARFGFRNIMDNSTYEIIVSGDNPTIVETIPGWSHDIANIGDTEMIVMLWANEIFDRANPDTIAHLV